MNQTTCLDGRGEPGRGSSECAAAVSPRVLADALSFLAEEAARSGNRKVAGLIAWAAREAGRQPPRRIARTRR